MQHHATVPPSGSTSMFHVAVTSCSMLRAYLWLIWRFYPQTRPDCDRGVAIVRSAKYVCNAALSNWNRSARDTEVFSGPSEFCAENIDPFLGDSSCCSQL